MDCGDMSPLWIQRGQGNRREGAVRHWGQTGRRIESCDMSQHSRRPALDPPTHLSNHREIAPCLRGHALTFPSLPLA